MSLFSNLNPQGHSGKMERTVPEACQLRQLRYHLRVDQVRRPVERGADQRSQHPGDAFLVVSRRPDGADMLPGWIRAGGIGRRPAVLVVDAEPGRDDHVRDLDTGRSAGVFRDDPGPDHRDGCARGDGFAGSAVLRRGHHSDGMVLRKVQDGGGRGYGAGRYQCL